MKTRRRFPAPICPGLLPRLARPVARPFADAVAVALALLGLVLVPAAAAAQRLCRIDPAHSSVHFSLGDTLHQFGGLFHVTSGDVTFDRATHKMSGQIVVAAASGDSGSAARDKRMKNEELHAKTFPAITFAPASFTGTLAPSGSSRIQVTGIFTLVGQPHSITVPMTVRIEGSRCTATGTFEVPYIAWGLKDPSIFMIRMGKEVRIDLSLTGTLTSSSAS